MNKTGRWQLMVAISIVGVMAGTSGRGQEIRTAAEDVDRVPRGMGRTVREIQNRHGGILEAKLSELVGDLLLADRDIAQYFDDNKTRRGATIYAVACGGAGDKTIRLIYYAAREGGDGGGARFGEVKGWVFTQLAAQGFASKGARLLKAVVGDEFTVMPKIDENLVEVVVHPSSSQAVEVPVAGKIANFR